MRLTKIVLGLAALPVVLSGCGALGLASATPATSASGTPVSGDPWIVVANGSATPSPSASRGAAPATALPSPSFLPVDKSCSIGWSTDDSALIPMTVTPAAGSLKVQWPARYGPNYRIAAVA